MRDKPTTTEQPISSELTSFLFFLPLPPPPLCSITVDSSADASRFPELSANPFGFQRPTQDLRSIPFSSTKPQTHQLNQPNNHRSQPNHHRIQPSQPIKSNRPIASQDHPWRAMTTPPTVTHNKPRLRHPRWATTTHEQTPDHDVLNPTYLKPPCWFVPHRSDAQKPILKERRCFQGERKRGESVGEREKL